MTISKSGEEDYTSAKISQASSNNCHIPLCFINLTPQTFPYLHKSILSEYGNIIWGPNYKVDNDKIEKVQRQATRLAPLIKHLRSFKLSTKYRRLHGNMIMT